MLNITEQIMDAVEKLSVEQQTRILELVQSWSASSLPPATSGRTLLAHIEDFHFEPGAVDAMMQIIQDDCEGVDADGW